MRMLAYLSLSLAACSAGAPTDTVVRLRVEEVASGLDNPVYVTSPADDARLFVVEQPGRIRIVQNGQLLSTPFLNISARVRAGGERGLLSVAFHPQYRTNGHFYVYFTAVNGDVRIERFTVSGDANVANAASAKLILSVAHPLRAHNGGLALFGPDGMLYLGLGDGGSPTGGGQNKNSLFGALLRIDVNSGDPYAIPAGNPYVGMAGARAEIWAIGLRNPWRYAFDSQAGLLFIADVGLKTSEEVNVVQATRAGVNYGWNIMEGSSCYNATTCNRRGLELPALEYDHSGTNCAVIGGFVYRGSAIPGLAGHYFYADLCAGWVKSFRYENGAVADKRNWKLGSKKLGSMGFGVTSFGVDSRGELYITLNNGSVYRIVRSEMYVRAGESGRRES